MKNNQEWVGGKQIYPSQNTDQQSNDDWLNDLNDEDFGLGRCGFKPKKDSFKIKTDEDEEGEDASI